MRGTEWRRRAAWTLAALAAAPAFAQAPAGAPAEAPAETPAAVLGDQIVVTAGRVEQRVGDVPVKVSLLAVHDLERTAAGSVDSFLNQLPSFNIQRPGSSRALDPSNSGVSLRGIGGSSASRTLVLVDGVPLNEPFTGWISWSRVPLATVERIEVVTGGGAVSWGNQSLGGVIHLITRRPSPATFEADARYGSRETVDVTALGSHVRGPAAFSAHVSRFDTAGYIEVPEEFRGPADTENGSRATVAGARMELGAGPDSRWTVEGTYLAEERFAGNVLSRDDLDLAALRVSGEKIGGPASAWRTNLFGLARESWNTRGSVADDHASVEPRRDQFDNPSRTLGADLSWNRALLEYDHLLTAGVDAQWTDSEIDENTSWIGDRWGQRFESGGEQLLAGLYVQDSAALGARWRLAAGGRVDLWRAASGFFVGTDLETGERLYDERLPDRSEVVFHPNLGVRYDAGPRLDLRAAVFQSFRAPTPNELYKSTPSQRTFTAANSDLDPERVVLGLEAGFDLDLPAATAVRVTGFWNEIEDAILDVLVGTAGPVAEVVEPCGRLRPRGTCMQRRNVERLRARGVELDAETRAADGWRIWASYTYTDSRVVGSRTETTLEGNWLRRVPEHQATLQLSYESARILAATLQARFLGDRYENSANSLVIDGATVLDLRLTRPLAAGIEALLTVENLLDEEVEVGKNEEYGELGAPRTVMAGIRWRWRGEEDETP